MDQLHGQVVDTRDFEAKPAPLPPLLAGFWRRVAADVLDVAVLWGFGQLLGAAFGGLFRALGQEGLLVGALVTIGYYTVCHSGAGRGTTLGKRVLGIEVVSLDGSYLSGGRSLARSLVLAALLYGSLYASLVKWAAPWATPAVDVLLVGAEIFLVFTCYFQVPLHPWKRGLQDLVAGSVVVHRGRFDARRLQALDRAAREATLLWLSASLAVVGVLVAVPMVGSRSADWRSLASLADLSGLEQRLAQPALREVEVSRSWSSFAMQGRPTVHHAWLTVGGWLRQGDPDDPAAGPVYDRCFAVAREAAGEANRRGAGLERIDVSLRSGWDIGIARDLHFVTLSEPVPPGGARTRTYDLRSN